MESALSELKKETGLSEDEIKDLTNETDVSQVLDQYKSNADKAMVIIYVPYRVARNIKIIFTDIHGRIPTVKLKIPGKAFLKSESRASVTLELYFSHFFRGSVFAKS